MAKCKHDIAIEDIASLKKYLKEIGNDHFDEYAEDGLEERVKFEMSTLYLYDKIKKDDFLNISIKEYDGTIVFIEECKKYNDQYIQALQNDKRIAFKSGCESLYTYYKEEKYILEGYNTNVQIPTGLSLVSIIYLISRMFFLDWIRDAKLNQNKYYVPIAFALSALLFSFACALILHTAGISTIPFLKDADLPANANIITFLPIHFTAAIVCSIIATAFLGLVVHKLNNAKTVESTIEVVFNKVQNNRINNLCTECNYSKIYRRLIPISAASTVALFFVAFIFEVQAHLQSSNSDLLGMGYLNKASFPLHLGTFICITAAIALGAFSIYKYYNKEDKKIIQNNEKNESKQNIKIVVDNKDQQHDEIFSNTLGQNVAKKLILCNLPEALIKNIASRERA